MDLLAAAAAGQHRHVVEVRVGRHRLGRRLGVAELELTAEMLVEDGGEVGHFGSNEWTDW
jgi:hypothetical protein